MNNLRFVGVHWSMKVLQSDGLFSMLLGVCTVDPQSYRCWKLGGDIYVVYLVVVSRQQLALDSNALGLHFGCLCVLVDIIFRVVFLVSVQFSAFSQFTGYKFRKALKNVAKMAAQNKTGSVTWLTHNANIASPPQCTPPTRHCHSQYNKVQAIEKASKEEPSIKELIKILKIINNILYTF